MWCFVSAILIKALNKYNNSCLNDHLFIGKDREGREREEEREVERGRETERQRNREKKRKKRDKERKTYKK